MRVLVCGSRTFSDLFAIERALEGLSLYDDGPGNPLTIIEGGADGADRWARVCARDFAWNLETYPADWKAHGKAAGPIRNQQMLDEGKPDVVWAFVDKPLAESRGTADMVRRARKAGIPTYVVECAASASRVLSPGSETDG